MATPTYKRVQCPDFATSVLATCVDLAASSAEGEILAFSDQFFAEAENLINPSAPINQPGRFTDNGAWYDGWETRRHNPVAFDWVIIRLGFSGTIRGFDLDTGFFNGNEAPAASIEACFEPDWIEGEQEVEWTELLTKVSLGPASQHYFKLTLTNVDSERIWTHVRLKIYPDGGLARCRVYGHVRPIWPQDLGKLVDLAYIGNGGRAVHVSDQHYGRGTNLILPGRGVNMGDGWETKRSRMPDHHDTATIRLGYRGRLFAATVDTYQFKGNFPESTLLEGCLYKGEVPPEGIEWVALTERKKLGAHKEHRLELSGDRVFSHVRMTIFPDGGVKRLRIYGLRDVEGAPKRPTNWEGKTIQVEPLTSVGFTAYGQVISSEAPSLSNVTARANQNTATKTHHVAKVVNLRQLEHNVGYKEAVPNLCVFRCEPVEVPVKPRLLERHRFSSQAFVPMGGVGSYLVIVALNGPDDRPDKSTVRAFLSSPTQGVSYNPGTWHHPMIALGKTIDFAVLVHENGEPDDCEEVDWTELMGEGLVVEINV